MESSECTEQPEQRLLLEDAEVSGYPAGASRPAPRCVCSDAAFSRHRTVLIRSPPPAAAPLSAGAVFHRTGGELRIMAEAEAHYEGLLAQHYTWVLGADFDELVERSGVSAVRAVPGRRRKTLWRWISAADPASTRSRSRS